MENVNITTLDYSLLLNFYPFDSENYTKYIASLNASASYNLSNLNPDYTKALIVFSSSSQILKSNTDLTVNVYYDLSSHSVASLKTSNLTTLFSSMLAYLISQHSGADLSQYKSEHFDSNNLKRVYYQAYDDTTCFLTNASFLAKYEKIHAPVAVCKYITDPFVDIVSDYYPYANKPKFSTCSCPQMLEISPIKQAPVHCVMPQNQSACVYYHPFSKTIRQDVVIDKVDQSSSRNFQLIKTFMTTFLVSYTILADDISLLELSNNQNLSNEEFELQVISIYEDYVNDIALTIAPFVFASGKKSYINSIIS